ncbi:hypothetical protein MFLAVUS_008388 [Mucor flavus]|uniref:Uncharacterized protein n=1 Tax=Mucor flavus TaxID=439312 RepID=A0ABP9Z6Y1_9FUNG
MFTDLENNINIIYSALFTALTWFIQCIFVLAVFEVISDIPVLTGPFFICRDMMFKISSFLPAIVLPLRNLCKSGYTAAPITLPLLPGSTLLSSTGATSPAKDVPTNDELVLPAVEDVSDTVPPLAEESLIDSDDALRPEAVTRPFLREVESDTRGSCLALRTVMSSPKVVDSCWELMDWTVGSNGLESSRPALDTSSSLESSRPALDTSSSLESNEESKGVASGDYSNNVSLIEALAYDGNASIRFGDAWFLQDGDNDGAYVNDFTSAPLEWDLNDLINSDPESLSASEDVEEASASKDVDDAFASFGCGVFAAAVPEAGNNGDKESSSVSADASAPEAEAKDSPCDKSTFYHLSDWSLDADKTKYEEWYCSGPQLVLEADDSDEDAMRFVCSEPTPFDRFASMPAKKYTRASIFDDDDEDDDEE